MHFKSLKFGLDLGIPLPMIESARLQLKLDAFICRLSEFVVHIEEVDVKVSFAFVEIVVPDLDAKHEISAVSAF